MGQFFVIKGSFVNEFVYILLTANSMLSQCLCCIFLLGSIVPVERQAKSISGCIIPLLQIVIRHVVVVVIFLVIIIHAPHPAWTNGESEISERLIFW